MLHVTDRVVIAIPVTARHKSRRYYFVGYQRYDREALQRCVDAESPSIALISFKARPISSLTDAELNERFHRGNRSKGEVEERHCSEVRKRNARYAMIAPLVESEDSVLLFDAELLRDRVRFRAEQLQSKGALGVACVDQVSEREKSKSLEQIEGQLRAHLNQFWAGGSIPGALTGFAANCGARGKRRKAGTKKRGKPSLRTRSGVLGKEGLNVTADSVHARNIKYCYDVYVTRRTTVMAGLRRMWDEFYSIAVQQADGTVKTEWLADWERPTRAHFDYWGTIESPENSAFKRQLAPAEFDKVYRALMGSASDDVYGIGQRGAMDSSPPDTQYVRAIDRRLRAGGGHRILLIDSLFGYIPGLYQGYDPPSSRTVRLAIVNAMNPDKRGWLDDLGLESLPAEDFIPMYFKNLWGDNTDLRSDEVMKCALSVGTNVHYVPKLRSDLNSVAESGHKTLHALVDHRMLGSTFGEARATRGEESATVRARHTMIEGIRESVRAIWVHNTADLDVERPLRMRLKNVPPTRVAMTKEMIRQGKVIRSAHAYEHFRRQLLPRVAGTFTAQGIRLHRSDTGGQVCFIGRLRWVSDHPVIVSWCEAARRGGKHDEDFFRASFMVDGSRPRYIWFHDRATGEWIELTARSLAIRDPDILAEMTLQDVEEATVADSEDRQDTHEARNKKLAIMERAQEATRDHARAEYAADVDAGGGEPTKSQMKSQKRENAEAERETALHGVPLDHLNVDRSPLIAGTTQPAGDDATEPSALSPASVPNSVPVAAVSGVVIRTGNSLLKAAAKKAAARETGQ